MANEVSGNILVMFICIVEAIFYLDYVGLYNTHYLIAIRSQNDTFLMIHNKPTIRLYAQISHFNPQMLMIF